MLPEMLHKKNTKESKTNKQRKILLYENTTEKYSCPHSYPRRAAMRMGFPSPNNHIDLRSGEANLSGKESCETLFFIQKGNLGHC